MTIRYHEQVEQGSDEWLRMRRGIITASNISKILTPKGLKISTSTGYLYQFCRQSIDSMPFGEFSTKHTDRGHIEEALALQVYEANHVAVKRCGFIENDNHGFTIGCSPDALVGDDGGVQVKSFTPDNQFGNIVDDNIEPAHMLQVQMELLVSEREWWDFIHQSSGTHQIVTRVTPRPLIHAAILDSCRDFYTRVDAALEIYRRKITDNTRYFQTEYVAGLYDKIEEEIVI